METPTKPFALALVLASFPVAGCEAASNAANGAGAFVEKTAQKIGESTEDAAITVAVKGAIFKADEKLAGKVSVGTFKRAVSLSGTVQTAEEKTRAEQIATGVKGVEKVINALDIVPVK